MKTFFIIVLLVGVVMVSKAKIKKLVFKSKDKKLSMSLSVGSSCSLKNGFKAVYCGKIRNSYVFNFLNKRGLSDKENYTFYLYNNQSFILGRKKYIMSVITDKIKFKIVR